MEFALFLLGTFCVFFVNGFPIVFASSRYPLSYRSILPSPIIGACLLSIVVTLLYRWGIKPSTAVLGTTSLSVAFALIVLVRHAKLVTVASAFSRRNAFRSLSFLTIIVLLLLPHILGGDKFAIFQGNRHDTINYLSGAFGFANYSYADLSNLAIGEQPAAGVLESAVMLSVRPTVALLYASIYKIFARDFLTNAYEYCLSAQLNFYFAFLYLVLILFPRRETRAQIVSVAFCVGFFGQYIFDINAWSELFAVPMMVVFIVDYCRGMLMIRHYSRDRNPLAFSSGDEDGKLFFNEATVLAFLFLRLPITAAGMCYMYPEICPVAGLACAAALIVAITKDIIRAEYAKVATALGASVLIALITLVIVSGFWKGTLGFLLNQLRIASSTSVTWHYFFQAYLFGGGQEVARHIQSSAGLEYLIDVFLIAPANFIAGLFGVYFLQVRGAWTRAFSTFYLIWSVALLAWFCTIIFGIYVAVKRKLREAVSGVGSSQFGLLAVGGVAVCLVPIGLLLKGQYWAAGKGLSMISPFLFAALILPVMSTHRTRAVLVAVSLVIASHISFGIARPAIVAYRSDGSSFPYPYPLISGTYKTAIDWDIARYEAQIVKCELVKIDIGEPFLDRVVQNYVLEKKLLWFSPRPQKSYYDEGVDLPPRNVPRGKQEDCTITDSTRADLAHGLVFFLNRNRILHPEYLLHEDQSLTVNTGIKRVLGQGWSGPESWGVWSDGTRAELLLPLMSGEFPSGVKVGLSFDAYVAAGRQQRLDISVARGKRASLIFDESHQQQTVELSLDQSDLSPSSATLVDLAIPDAISPADTGGADTRRLGVGLTKLSVRKR